MRTAQKGRSTMIELQRETMSKAIEKAHRIRNHVHMIRFRLYEVITPELRAYQVAFEVREGKKFASCNCKAGKRSIPCYHVAAAVVLHMAVAKMYADQHKQQAEAPKPAPAPRDILVRRDCAHQECKSSRCEKGEHIGGIAV
jgi:hypothetical protein